ncbi:MAG TPA: M14 metallopeptidase family protein [Pyrinomonadaceae bacterium]|nr:M14 metallopeptidase family protein [Pyrinomonadaceae bacterium]
MPARTLTQALLGALLLLFLFTAARETHGQTSPVATTRRATAPVASVPAASVPAPEDVLGFRPGDDRKLAAWQSIVEYFRRLDAASDRVRFEELGRTTLGAPFVLATISAPENLARLDQFKEIQRQLADPRTLRGAADRRAENLIARGKTIVLITCGVHSTEVGSTLSSMLIAHRLASSDDAQVRRILKETIVLLVPSLNPDGVDIVKRWYDKTLGTPHEGTSPPELYHKYTGHDNNRDWYAFTQVETQLTVDKVHNVWHPQIVHDIHQQGVYGSRLFLPPYMRPVEPNVPRPIVEGYTELGLAMAKGMLAQGFKGITWDSTYDAWTPARAYSHYHGGVRILSETASVNIATPVNIKFESLRSGEGYDAKKASANFPEVWRGGEWHLRDITNYMTTGAFELMSHAAANRERWLRRFYEVGKEAVRPRRSGELQGFRIPPSANRFALLTILERAGVEVEKLPGAAAGRRRGRATMDYESPVMFVPLAQPYGSFAKALLESQRYPDLRDAEGHPVSPYDVTAHTLPLLMGVPVEPVYSPVRVVKRSMDEISVIAPVIVAPRERPGEPRLAVYKSHVPSMDEGWTRWVLEQESIAFASLEDAEARAGNLRAKFDAIIIPDQSPRAILEGYRKGSMPEEITGGLGEEGVNALGEFVRQGGTLVALNQASDFAIKQLKLPVRDVTEGLKRTEFYAPGSILRTVLDTTHPLARGMAGEGVAWVEDSPAFEIVSDPLALARVKIIARYPQSGTPLLSGWLLGGERLRGKAALVEVGLGEGRVYLFGFRPQYRAQTLATYPLLFNAIKSQSASGR